MFTQVFILSNTYIWPCCICWIDWALCDSP